MSDFFRKAAHTATLVSGSWQFFVISVAGIALWAALGPAMGYSDTWQLLVNTPTTVLTYLLGILILLEANRQSKESKVVHDELLHATEGARERLINIDQMTDEQVDQIEQQLRDRADRRTSRDRKRAEGNRNHGEKKVREKTGASA
ncbi:MAG: low affinity iron permease family protein [Chloroflexota bacterium]